MNRIFTLAGTLALSTALFTGCATGGSSSGGMASMETAALNDGENVAGAELATKLGIDPTYVQTAIGATKSALAGGAGTPEAKSAAVQSGVDKATSQAASKGITLTADQKSGLQAGVNDILKL